MRLATDTLLQLAKTAQGIKWQLCTEDRDYRTGEDSDDVRQLQATASILASATDEHHWSEKTGRYADYGLHTRNVRLERQVVVLV